ncbi:MULTISPECIES: hypothetical protein [Pseudoalteromonas]|uniref:Uncharacterized protein n=2 Tax=Pseudoalteromonas TaxID=53246 RepID=V4HAQ9_PSEL2|nr:MULTISPECIES: hypothetical protein [Pseudoalteromonas]ESP94561.1 hypothetical protein PL2TA16_00561 [Pseudoalteromonas luteoviolacea 2ta16]KZN32256.1 hypothetical protein N483_03660 [Pseudoalteromonas luteoviolacea NCIMB 1944]MBQ4834959.1 hypothetical protein [Pseudoalteromonas luteoviolacea]MDK2597252.1 hypothetical protein [Pseudoalteromonas sp. P94(2023)]
MKVKLNKKPLKKLSKNKTALPVEATPQIAGGSTTYQPTDPFYQTVQ